MSIAKQVRAAVASLFGFPLVDGGKSSIPGYPDTILGHPYQLDRLKWDYPRAVRMVSTVRACVLRIANDTAMLPVVFERQSGSDFEPVQRKTGNIVDVWSRPNPQQTSWEFVRDLTAHLKASGNAYLIAEDFNTGRVQQLWLPEPQYVEIVPGKFRRPDAYVYNRGGRRESIRPENVIHFRGYNPDAEPYGASDLESVEMQYSNRHDTQRLMQLFIRNGGMPAGFFTVKTPDGKSANLSEPEARALENRIQRLFGGIQRAFRPHLVNGVDFLKLGMSPDEMKLIEMSNMSDQDICRALGVPPWLIGIKDGQSKIGDSGSSRSDVRIYWQNTIMPLIAFRDSVLTEFLVPRFEKNVRARTDFSAVLELNEPVLQNAKNAVAVVGRPFLTVNEMRSLLGKPPIADPSADELQPAPQPMGLFGAGADPGADSPKNGPDAPNDGKSAPTSEKKSRMIDGDSMREKRRKRAAANLARYERRMQRVAQAMLDRQKERILGRIEGSGARGQAKRAIDIDSVLLPDPDDAEAMEELLAQLVAERGEEALADLGLQLNVAINNARASSFLKSTVARTLTKTSETTREAVRLQLAEGLARQETTAELMARIERMPEFDEFRAALIARTEVGGAYNFAAVNAYEQSGVVNGVEWLSARDSHVRETHAEADGQIVGLGEAFAVGDSSLEFPGDPSGDPSEVCNCRCTVEPVVDEEAVGRAEYKQWLTRILSDASSGAERSEPGPVLEALRAKGAGR